MSEIWAVYDQIPVDGSSIGETELAIACNIKSFAEIRDRLDNLAKKGWAEKIEDSTRSRHWKRIRKKLTDEQLIGIAKTGLEPVELAMDQGLSVGELLCQLKQLIQRGKLSLEGEIYHVCT
jgi:hypothetical protein